MKSIGLVAILLAVLATPAAAQDTTVRLGTEGAYPPYNFIDDSGDVAGFERELGDALCSRAGLTCTWVTNDWDSIIPNLVQGNYDAIIAAMSITDERDQVIDFSDNYTRPDPSAYAAMSDDVELEGGVIAAQTGTVQAAQVAESGATLVEFATPDDTVAALRNGQVDAVLADKGFLEPVVQQDSQIMFVGEDIFLGDGMGVGLRESDDDLQQAFNEAIASMKADGSLNTLIEKWLPESETF